MENDLGHFLHSRRARIRPEELGLRPYGRRRVPGLRREELAEFAGISLDYYVRLEQGRSQHVSDEVLNAVARVLQFDATERAHLRDLARPVRGRGGHAAKPVKPPERVRPGVRRMLDSITDSPDPVLLFRFSALTYNGHRIHYDRPYATQAEGYPDLVVHGPLLALLALELPRVHAPGRRVRAFDYRLVRPAFMPSRIVSTGQPHGTAVEVVVGPEGAGPSLTATIGLE